MKEAASAVAVVITVVGTIPYVLGVVRGRIKPHAFSWLIWALTTLIAFAGQLAGHGGIGAAAAGASALVGLVVGGYALRAGERDFKPLDWWCLGGSFAALGAWAVTTSPLAAVVLVAVVDAVASVPTVRKAYWKPDEEGISAFVLANFKWLFAVYALARLNAVTLVYPLATSTVNFVIIGVVLVRRAQLKAAKSAALPVDS